MLIVRNSSNLGVGSALYCSQWVKVDCESNAIINCASHYCLQCKITGFWLIRETIKLWKIIRGPKERQYETVIRYKRSTTLFIVPSACEQKYRKKSMRKTWEDQWSRKSEKNERWNEYFFFISTRLKAVLSQ